MKKLTDIVTIQWTCSDGFRGSLEYVNKLYQRFPNILHFFDFTHEVKGLRNRVKSKILIYNGQEIVYRIMYDIFQKIGLNIDDVHPSDIMNVSNVLNLFRVRKMININVFLIN
jgi:hypothetical protein